MTAYWWYMLKVSICIIVFYGFFIWALKNSTFFMLNRLYLISGLLLSFIIPVLNLSIFEGQSSSIITNNIYATFIEPDYNTFQLQKLKNDALTINYSTILSVIYFTGVSIMFLKLVFSIYKINRICNNSDNHRIGKKKILKADIVQPFSFLNMIFLPKNESNPMIIEHEMAHTKQFHWFDLLIIEIVALLLWFNPFVVLYKNSLKLQHEYLADRSVINDRNKIEIYLDCMLKHIQTVSYEGPISQFYCKTIKKRIVMITKNKTSVKYLGVYILILPLISGILFGFTLSKSNYKPITTSNIVENKPSICPVDIKKVTKTMGFEEWINPITKKKDFHRGEDFAIAEGENIISPASGIVVENNFNTKSGNYLSIKHDEKYSTFYAHFKSSSVKVGDKIEKGQIIGITGNTGTYSTAPHLHYEVIKTGERVDPKDYMPK